jgi:hypothetical protein
MRPAPPTLVIDFGTTSAAAMVVADHGAWLLPDPGTGEARWRRTLQPPAEMFSAMRHQAQRGYGAVDRAVVTIPASVAPGDPRRSRLVGAAEAAGFTAVELVLEAVGPPWAPGSPAVVGDVVLVYDLGATFEAVLLRVGDDLPEIVGHSSIHDWPAEAAPGTAAAVELTLACCRDLLGSLGPARPGVRWILPVGGGARTPAVETVLERGLGLVAAHLEEPELAVVRGIARWLPRSGPRLVMARPAPERMTPLVFTIPGGSAQLLRWLVQPEESYDEGAPLARVRLAGGALWDLTARTRGTLDQVLVEGGSPVSSGEWLGLVRN